MKYFELQDNCELKYAPRIKDWYGKFDTRNIMLKKFPSLPQRQLFILEPATKIMFTDFILFPFLLVSPSVMNIIQMYRELCFYREVILLDQVGGESKLYYLPVFNETSKLSVVEKGEKISKTFDANVIKEKVYIDKKIFWVNDTLERHTIISLDLAESILKRNITGLGIKEVELFIDKERK